MKSALSLAAALMTLPVAAEAAQDVSAAFGNTIVSTYPDKRTALLWLQADGDYSGSSRRKTAMSGRWELKGEKICLKQKEPFPSPITYCLDLSSGSPEKGWSAKAVTGEPIRVTIVKGILRH
jgi:hypothetical protein